MSRMYRSLYIAPQINIQYDTNNTEFIGWLTKKSMWLKVSKASIMFPNKINNNYIIE